MKPWYRNSTLQMDDPEMEWLQKKDPASCAVWEWMKADCQKRQTDKIRVLNEIELDSISGRLGVTPSQMSQVSQNIQQIGWVTSDMKIRGWKKWQRERMKEDEAERKRIYRENQKNSKNVQNRPDCPNEENLKEDFFNNVPNCPKDVPRCPESSYVNVPNCPKDVPQCPETSQEIPNVQKTSQEIPNVPNKRRGDEMREEENKTPIVPKGDVRQQALEIYEIYPRKVAKPQALRAMMKSLKKVGVDVLLEKVKKFAEIARGEDPRFVPHPATWFNQERFNDDSSTWARDGVVDGRRDPRTGLKLKIKK